VLVDFDRKGMPPETASRLEKIDGVWNVLVTVIPDLARAGRVERPSTSTGLYNTQTGERIRGSGGYHYYVLIKDGTDAERFLQTLHARCWLNGWGWSIVGKAGHLLERSLVDRVCGTPERLAFEGPPVLEPPISQDDRARRAVAVEGEALDTVAVCPPLNVVELALLKELRSKEAYRLAGDMAKAHEQYITSQAERLVARTGMTPHRARATIARQCCGVLLPDIELPFDDAEFNGMTGKDVLADPARFEGAPLADPIEGIEYGRCKARIMRRADGSVWIHSFAHGRSVYELKFDFVAVKSALEKAAKEEAADLLVRMVLAAELEEDEIEELRNIACKIAGITKPAMKSKLKRAQDAAAAARKAAERNRRAALRPDPRPRFPAPADDGEVLPVVKVLNLILGSSSGLEPPTRNPNNGVVQAREIDVPSLHALTSEESNSDDNSKEPATSAETVDLA
jgi:hypothetical protein